MKIWQENINKDKSANLCKNSCKKVYDEVEEKNEDKNNKKIKYQKKLPIYSNNMIMKYNIYE